MQPEQIELVKQSFGQVVPQADELSRRFYDRLFTDAPETRAMFPEEMDAQRVKLLDEIAAIVDALDHLTDLVSRTSDLGRRHVDYGTTPAHYAIMREVLIGSLGDVLGDELTPATKQAWQSAYDLVSETMMYGASHGPTGKADAGKASAKPSWRDRR